MGNCHHRANRCYPDPEEPPWNLRLQNATQRTRRFLKGWSCHTVEGCSCLGWKKISMFKERQDSQKENEGMTSVRAQQDHVKQTNTEEVCYMLVSHRSPRRPSGTPAEDVYENVSCKAERPRASVEGTEYSVLRVSCTPRPPPSSEDEYELLVPSRFSYHTPKQPLTDPFETLCSHLQ